MFDKPCDNPTTLEGEPISDSLKAAIGCAVVLVGLVSLAFMPSPIPVIPPARDCLRWHQILRLNLVLDARTTDHNFYLAIESACDLWRPQPIEAIP